MDVNKWNPGEAGSKPVILPKWPEVIELPVLPATCAPRECPLYNNNQNIKNYNNIFNSN